MEMSWKLVLLPAHFIYTYFGITSLQSDAKNG